MNKIFVCCLLFFVNGFLLAQSKEEKLQQLNRRNDLIVTEVEKNIYKIENKISGDAFLEDLSEVKILKNNANLDSMVVEIFSIDTAKYSDMYIHWLDLDISNSFYGLLINDLNSNGLTELYGNRSLYNSNSLSPSIFELDQTGELFNQVYTYPDTTLTPKIFYDFDNDGVIEMLMRKNDGGLGGAIFFKQSELNSFPTTPYFEYPKASNKQINFPTFGDFDKDEMVEFAYQALGKTIYIAEFNPATTNFDSIYSFTSINYVGNITVSDFDMNGKTDIITSNVWGDVHLIEAQGDNQYSNVWNGIVDVHNAYYSFATNDIDKNGKPEFWVGGKDFSNGILFTCFETNVEHSYEPVFKIKIPDYYTVYPLTAFTDDIDGNGKEEIVICADYFFLVLKFTGSPDRHGYNIWYFNLREFGIGETWTVKAYDINDDGKKELFFDTYTIKDSLGQSYYKSINKIFKPNFTVGVEEKIEKSIDNFNLFPNYPNPFNPSTNIKFELKKSENVLISIYNILGKEIKILMNENLPTGAYTIQWDGKDNKGRPLSSGVYFIKMIAGNFQRITKAVLLK